MPALPDRSSTYDVRQQVDDILDQWEDAVARGDHPSVEDLCRECPDLLEEVRRQVHALEQMRETFETQTTTGTSEEDTKPGLTMTSEFRDLRLHATGGLGRVYRATGVDVRRDVAIKFLRKRHQSIPDALQQFLAEAEITSRLDHPGVVPVFGLGQTESGERFYVMRLIQGEELEQEIKDFHSTAPMSAAAFESMGFRDLVQRIISACKTVAYAHSRGIIHLDLKPKNIMLGRYGDTIVVDWGCAMAVGRTTEFRHEDEKSLRLETVPGSSSHGAGTPAYMSPEQVNRETPLTPASDIFSLGATLFKLLTGRPPYLEGRQPRFVPPGTARDFPAPRELQPKAPRHLEAVCLKAMALHPTERYLTALDLAGDLERFLAGNPVSALEEGFRDRSARWMKRHRGVVLSAFSALIAVMLLSLLAAGQFAKVARTEKEARQSIEELQVRTLSTSARYAADLFAREIESRWNILQLAALDPELQPRLEQASAAPNDSQARDSLQAWLDRRFIEYDDLNARSWFLVDAKGVQLALSPIKHARSIGKNYAHRDYFHGQGRDLVADAIARHGPCDKPHISTPYFSDNTDTLRIALTVPVWKSGSRDGQPIAVLGMSSEMGQFTMLEDATLVDLRPDWLEGDRKRGLVLQHPGFHQLRRSSAAGKPELHRVSDELLTRLEKLHVEGARSSDVVDIEHHYRDAINQLPAGELQAAFAPVVIRFPDHDDQRRVEERSFAIIVAKSGSTE
jgi:eukaryotic-like serine/threonine-protein kinase